MSNTLGMADTAQYETLLNQKVKKTEEEFRHYSPPSLKVFASPPEHFRMRAEFKIWHKEGEVDYAMYKPGEYKKPVIIDSFTIGSRTITELMPRLLEEVKNVEELKKRLFQVEFLTTSTGDSVITLIYHRPLDEKWEAYAKVLQDKLNTKIIGRSRKQKITLSEDYVIEKLTVGDTDFSYQQVETGFTQPNAAICKEMLTWAQKASKNLGNDLLELYCGNGNFTLPLSKNFEKVLATEVSKTSVNSANYNITLNKCENISVVRMSSEEFTEAQKGVRKFNRLRHINLSDYNFSTVFVDPPRAGLDEDTEKMVAQFDNILYISCNPETLNKNLSEFTKTHEIKEFALFDQFPYTDHRECGVLLSRKS